jgi:hypothetical protein
MAADIRPRGEWIVHIRTLMFGKWWTPAGPLIAAAYAGQHPFPCQAFK